MMRLLADRAGCCGIFLHLFYRSRVAVKSLDAGIQNFCGCEIGALTLQYALIAAGIATAIIALVSGEPI
jgi:hypothetical protein